MMNWALHLVGVFDLLLGGVIIAGSIIIMQQESGADHTSEIAWIGVASVLVLVAIGVFLRQSWARIVGLLIALLLVFVTSVFVFRNGLTFQGGQQQLKLMLVIAVGVSQLFSLMVLVFGWSPRQRNLIR